MSLKLKLIGFLIILAIVIILVILFNYGTRDVIILPNVNDTTIKNTIVNNSSSILYANNSTSMGSDDCKNATDIVLVNNDHIINNINWSKYPLLEKSYISDNRVAGPNSVINHTFIVVTVRVNIKDPDNTNELYHEMAGMVIEIRQVLGPNSSPEVMGEVNGIYSYDAEMIPFDNRIFVVDHYHPQAYKNDIYLIPGNDIYDYHNYTLINNSVVEP